MTSDELRDDLLRKVKRLCDCSWGGRINLTDVNRWLAQFQVSANIEDDEQLHALYLLSNFVYFGQEEIRELLRSLFRDLFRTPIVHGIRRANAGTRSESLIKNEFANYLSKTRFLGVGNPSESGSHLLYFFRQENALPKSLFISTHRIFQRGYTGVNGGLLLRDPNVDHYVFIDDICGSGTQAAEYSEDLVEPIKKLNSKARVSYLVLFATSRGLNAIRRLQRYDDVAAVFELDSSFRSFSPRSRIFTPDAPPFLRKNVRSTASKYGKLIWSRYPLGYKFGQLLLGFSHNTPDNTLPIFWADEKIGGGWTPLFRRYQKDYS